MRTPASIARHPIHPMLVTLPIGLWVFSFACDLVFAFGSGDPVWKTVALYAMVGGLIGALAAAIPGLIDLLSLPAGPRRTAIIHMSLNLTIVATFAINIWLRWSAGDAGAGSSLTVWLSLVSIGLLLVSGWLGGKLVFESGVAVDTENLGIAEHARSDRPPRLGDRELMTGPLPEPSPRPKSRDTAVSSSER